MPKAILGVVAAAALVLVLLLIAVGVNTGNRFSPEDHRAFIGTWRWTNAPDESGDHLVPFLVELSFKNDGTGVLHYVMNDEADKLFYNVPNYDPNSLMRDASIPFHYMLTSEEILDFRLQVPQESATKRLPPFLDPFKDSDGNWDKSFFARFSNPQLLRLDISNNVNDPLDWEFRKQ